MNRHDKHIVIVGAGLVGSLLGIYLLRSGYRVSIFERRSDPRIHNKESGRSINLALSVRGLISLKEVGLQDEVKKLIIPMKGRMIHDSQGNTSLQPYGDAGQAINSVSRIGLNQLMLNRAEEMGAKLHFNRTCTLIDLKQTRIDYQDLQGSGSFQPDYIVGADGAFSAVRSSMAHTDRFQYQQYYIEHGYKEIDMPPKEGSFALEPNALHIWPRKSFMLIALPNLDKSFTCTLFLPFEGDNSFERIHSDKDLLDFFDKNFVDVRGLIPDLTKQYHKNPTSSLVTIRSYPWVRNNSLLIGDAAHAIVPFYGQGMNCGFEDCRIFNATLQQYDHDWEKGMNEYQKARKNDADAISTLAINNFLEMRDKVVDPEFILRKKIEALMHAQYPEKWIPLYSMVTFQPEMSYSEALERGLKQDTIMQQVMKTANIESVWQDLDYSPFVDQLVKQL